MLVAGATATVQGAAIRNTLPNGQGLFGWGVSAQPDPATGVSSTLTLSGSLIDENHVIGVFVGGADATVGGTVVRTTLAGTLELSGRGVQVQYDTVTGAPSSATLTGVLVEQSTEAGVAVVDSPASIEGCLVRNNAPNAVGALGDGVVVFSETSPATATILGTRIEQSTRAAVSSFGAEVTIGGSLFSCQLFDWAGNPSHGFDYSYHDQGGNLCGCPDATDRCRIDSATIEPPDPVGGLE